LSSSADGAASSTNSTAQKAYLGCGVVGIVLIFLGMILAKILPLPSPDENSTQIAAFFTHHATAIRYGLMLVMLGASLLGPWLGVLTVQLKRVEGRNAAGAYCQLALGALLIIEIIYPLVMLQVVAFRPERAASETLLISDLSWILFVAPGYTFVVEAFATVAVIWSERNRPRRLFPSWLAPFGAVVAVANLGECFSVVTKTGPFAWNGFFGFWFPAILFGLWIVVMTVALYRAVDQPD
jgi:hypothetical protein